MAKPLADKMPDHSHRPGGGPNYPLPLYGGGYMGDPYGAYGGGGPAYNQVSQLKQTFRCSEHIFARL
jgi:heterogeneous nuclear ribonucleoprotein R